MDMDDAAIGEWHQEPEFVPGEAQRGVPVSRGTGEGELLTIGRGWLVIKEDGAAYADHYIIDNAHIWRHEAYAQREANAALTAEVQRLRGVVEEAITVALDHADPGLPKSLGHHVLRLRAALTPPAADTEGKE